MTQFNALGIKQMEPRPGAAYATTYTKISSTERARLKLHVDQIILELCELSVAQRCTALEQPLRGFARSGAEPNYSAYDILADMKRQLESGKDIPSGMLGRWNRLFSEWPDVCIEFEQPQERVRDINTFRSIFR